MKANGTIQGKFSDGRRFRVLDGQEIPADVAQFMGLSETTKTSKKAVDKNISTDEDK
jgi:hypothetical protein